MGNRELRDLIALELPGATRLNLEAKNPCERGSIKIGHVSMVLDPSSVQEDQKCLLDPKLDHLKYCSKGLHGIDPAGSSSGSILIPLSYEVRGYLLISQRVAVKMCIHIYSCYVKLS